MKPISTISTLALAAAATLLQGCVGTMPLNQAGTAMVSGVRNAVQPDTVTEYKTAVTAEYKLFEQAFTQLKAGQAGQPEGTNDFAEARVKYVRGLQTWEGKSLKEVRLALPGDAVTAKHKAVTEALDAFARYSAKRPDANVTRLFVTAPSAADRAWLATQLRKAGVKEVEEQTQAYISVGFTTPGLQLERQVN